MLYIGYCKWFGSKGEAFGYINRFKHEDGTPGEIFVHYKGLTDEGQLNPKFKVLLKDQRVEFEIGTGYPTAGSQAINVKVLL